ncbi:MAG: hypothetical protein ACPG4X_20975 [Pikeienuella sp.]
MFMEFMPYIASALAALGVMVGAYFKGKRKGKDDAARKAMQSTLDTRKRMDEVDLPATAHDADAWLRNRSKQ